MARIIAFVLRSVELERLLSFYSLIGLSFEKEQHEGGPEHLASSLSGDIVLELYPRTKKVVDDAIIIQVESLKSVLAKLEKEGFLKQGDIEFSGEGDQALIHDPDGRPVYLVETKVTH